MVDHISREVYFFRKRLIELNERKLISKRLGHANPKITLEFYAHLLPNRDSDIADTFHQAILTNTEKSCGQVLK